MNEDQERDKMRRKATEELFLGNFYAGFKLIQKIGENKFLVHVDEGYKSYDGFYVMHFESKENKLVVDNKVDISIGEELLDTLDKEIEDNIKNN